MFFFWPKLTTSWRLFPSDVSIVDNTGPNKCSAIVEQLRVGECNINRKMLTEEVKSTHNQLITSSSTISTISHIKVFHDDWHVAIISRGSQLTVDYGQNNRRLKMRCCLYNSDPKFHSVWCL